ncbi:MAG: tyrosine-type recombinase/integrase [Candidatus Methanofastidiosia archaeon]
MTVRDTKNYQDGYVIISEKCCMILKDYLNERTDDNEALFVIKRKPYRRLSGGRIQNIIKEISDKVNLGRSVTPHDLRSTFATLMLENEGDLFFVKEQLRHKNIQSTMRYLKVSMKARKKHYDRHMPEF